MKANLNGHYCLNTEEHKRKLVEDGCVPSSNTYKSLNHKYYFVFESNSSLVFQSDFLIDNEFKPMHLHNNEWVFGSLEHEPMYKNTMMGGYHEDNLCSIVEVNSKTLEPYPYCNEPKQVQRIEFECMADIEKDKIVLYDYEISLAFAGTSRGGKKYKVIFEEIEANQKDKS